MCYKSHMSKIKWALILLLLVNIVQAQQAAFWSDIQAFKKQDSIQQPPHNPILFIGSSSFTNWKDVKNYFPGYTIVDRGFGGSSLTDVIRYADDIIFPYQPKQVVIYCGENDLASSDTVTSEMVLKRFTALFELIRKKLPGVPIVFISLKPSPSRWHLRQKIITANDAIKNFLVQKKNTEFVNVYDKMHMNAKGYAIWQREIKPALRKLK